jgi:hypothetical protein
MDEETSLRRNNDQGNSQTAQTSSKELPPSRPRKHKAVRGEQEMQ